MKALTIIPGEANSLKLRDIDEPAAREGGLLCEMLAVGVCGTDFDIKSGHYGKAPVGAPYLVIGHESLGRVIESGDESKFKKGDLVVGFVRRADPVPCPNCAVGEWDMCRNNLYTERGISGLQGFASERFRINEEYCIRLRPELEEVGVLVEPASVVAKAWEQSEKIASRSAVQPKTALITGAGPVGLLAALIGKQKNYEVHVLDHATGGPKPALVKELGAQYHGDVASLEKQGLEFDITIECTGASELILTLFNHIKSDGILCLAGISTGGRDMPTDIGALNLKIVLQNEVIFGSVNANRRHYVQAAEALSAAPLEWLKKLITRRVPLSRFAEAFERTKTDIKTVLIQG